jgi:4-carboxymuconolactone decarboxylase
VAALPDPTSALSAEQRDAYDRIAAVRGEGQMLEVYHRLFNHPAVATGIGALGEQLRYRGQLPDDVRELVVLREARRMGVAYEWAHHVGPARAAGLSDEVLAALEAGDDPPGLRDDQRLALEAAAAVHELRRIPDALQDALTDAFGVAGVIELAAVVGIYRLMGGMVIAFDVDIEPGFPRPTWAGDRTPPEGSG